MFAQGQGTSKNTITRFEYEPIDGLSDHEINLLSKLSGSTGEILRPIGQSCFQARQFVGVLRLGRRTLQILPKFHSLGERQQVEPEATRNLLLMLDYAGHLGIREVNLATLQRAQDWFEVMIYLFAMNLQRQWLKGAPRTYESIDAVLPVLKGKWRLPTQLRRPEQKHLFAITYDEFTADNALNRVLRYVVEKLWQLTRNSQNRQMLSELRYWMDGVTLPPIVTPQMAKGIALSRLNQQYEPLLNLARLFLEGLGLQLSVSDQTAFAFIFDMNQLFEGFLTGFIQRHRRDILPESLRECRLLPQGRATTVYLAQHRRHRVFKLKPDLLFEQGTHYPLLMDFKYKSLDPEDPKLGIKEADFYQMYAYLNRFNTPPGDADLSSNSGDGDLSSLSV
jgi:5-methylcytosine-specific restriction enzyme subunit McrC